MADEEREALNRDQKALVDAVDRLRREGDEADPRVQALLAKGEELLAAARLLIAELDAALNPPADPAS